MSKVIHYINSTNWLKNSTFSETASAGTNYTSFLGNGSGSRLVTSIPIWLYDDTFTITLAPNFNFAGLYFDKDKKYLGRSTGYVEWASTTPRELTKPSNAVYMLMYLKRTSGSLLPEDVAEANLTITYSNLDNSRVFASDGISLSDTKTLEETVSNHSTSISNNATAIALKANSSDVYTKTETDGLISTEVSNRNSAIEQSASQIQLSVSETYSTKTEFDELEIGGRNLVRGTSFDSDSDLTYWFKNQNPIISVESGSLKIIANQTSSTPGVCTDISIEEGKYTVSFWYKAITENGMKLHAVSLAASNRNAVVPHVCSITISDTEWHYYEHIFELTAAQAENISMLIIFLYPVGYAATDGIYIRHFKLEKGNRATDWTPAPEDHAEYTDNQVESAKAAIKITTDGITSTVEKISSIKYLETAYQYTLNGIRAYAAENYSGSWNTTDTKDAKIGDTVYLKVKDNTRNCYVYIKATVTAVSGNRVTCTSHGYEDVLPVDTIKSTINQSSDSVKIQARHVEIDGTAIFTAISSDVDDAITDKGYATTTQAQGYANTAEQNAKTYAEGQADAVNSALETYKTTTNSTLTSLQNQVDGQIEAWYKTVDPTSSNEPASVWNTDALKARHEGDIYYNVESGHSWRWMKSGSTYSWQQIPDSDAAAALAAAQNAQSLANSKRRIFTSTPTVPYDVGDLWVDGTSIKYANASKTDSQTYSESDWAVTATDDSSALDAISALSNQLGESSYPYQEVEWIESNGKQFIYLDWKPVAETFGFEVDFIIRNTFSTSAGAWNATTNINGFGNVFGVRNSSMNNDFQLGSYNSSGLVRMGNRDTLAYITRNTRQTCSLIGNVYTDPSGTARTITKGATVSDKPYHNMSIFAMYEGATRKAGYGNFVQPGSVRIYSLKFYENTTVAVDLTPAVRLSDNVAGLWDSVSNHFYPARGALVGEPIDGSYFGTIQSLVKTIETTNPSLITTNTIASRLWTADAFMLDDLVDGQQITITPLYNSVATTRPEELSEWDESTTSAVGNVYIKLTLANNKITEWIPVYYTANSRLTTHYVSGAPLTLTYHENMMVNVADTGGSTVVRGWFQQPDYNTNTTYNLGQNIHGTAITAKEAITRYHLIMGDALGYQNVAAGDTFDISYPLLLAYAAAIAATKTSTGTYETYPAADFSYNGTIEAGAANKMLYLKGTISGNTFTVAASPFMTTVVPDEADGYLYIPLGIMSSVKLANFVSSKDLYAYLDGDFRQVTPTEIVSTHRIYYRTAIANLSLAAPTTWVEEATGNVYNQWTTKVPPLAASTASGQTKYLYLYTCEQRKRLDGTTVCTKVLLDENITVIDGGSIITNSVTANQIAANTITAAEIEAGTITATEIASSAITTDKLDASAVTADKIDATDLHVRAANIDGTIGFGQLSGVQASGNYALTSDLTTEINQRKAQYGTCSTAAGTTPKAVTCANFELVAGNEITIKFSTANTSSGKIQLNVNSTGNKDVWVGNAVTSATNMLLWGANAYITFKYDGTQFQVIGEPRTWYGECSVAEATAAKTSTITGCVICKGTKVELAMTYANSAASPTLNISSTGAKNLYFGTGTTRPTIAGGTSWLAANTATFTFDGATWRTQGKTYIDANSITTGYISADRIQGGSLSIGMFNNSTQADILNSNITVPTHVTDLQDGNNYSTTTQMNTAIGAAEQSAKTYADGKDSAIAAAARRTDVAIAVTAIDYDAGTATLQATLYIDGVVTTNNVTYKWLKDGSLISGATSRTLSVTAAMGLGHIYSCTIDYT